MFKDKPRHLKLFVASSPRLHPILLSALRDLLLSGDVAAPTVWAAMTGESPPPGARLVNQVKRISRESY
ncbi:hypothetical protein [Fimbriiglobus ruber]|uniref:Uncharacterized protein n=1 Tax=Fimbriiglobus ruber TaxID=1908690 RepID=A0A225DCV3_9BACT|nr:hypothetical protein [Fimbriiglobus ruber]OWK34235.1 hypothetical protein FRUB_10206 [Fimbriiglobus ruber]